MVLELYSSTSTVLEYSITGYGSTDLVIEKAASRLPVYTTSQYETLILGAFSFKTHLPTVHCFDYHKLIDFKDQAYHTLKDFLKFLEEMSAIIRGLNYFGLK